LLTTRLTEDGSPYPRNQSLRSLTPARAQRARLQRGKRAEVERVDPNALLRPRRSSNERVGVNAFHR